MEREKYSNELNKIPESAKTIAQRRRREDLEREMGILGRNISGLKAKLKELDAL
jgi:predicted  nucleic acid-binding Zn-ribbon protein